ncbi:unnamed protein product [Discula destructiva]
MHSGLSGTEQQGSAGAGTQAELFLVQLDDSRKFEKARDHDGAPFWCSNTTTLRMSRSTTATRELARTLFQSSPHCSSTSSSASIPRTRCAALQFTQPFSSTNPRRDDDDTIARRQNRLAGLVQPRTSQQQPIRGARPAGPPPPTRKGSLNDMIKLRQPQPQSSGLSAVQTALSAASKERTVNTGVLDKPFDATMGELSEDALKPAAPAPEPYHFHIFSHKHNTHVTVTKPNRDPIVSLSCGNLGFRKSNRKQYDAAYQLGAYVVDKLQQNGWHNKIGAMEVSLRGFGPGREAVTKVLMGTEGTLLRAKVTKVSDSTRLKFGGTRSKKPRRL